MSLQQRICKAFCAEVKVNPFRGGFGVSTPFADALTGDPIGFYVVGPQPNHRFKIIDDALTVARFESEGASLDSKQQALVMGHAVPMPVVIKTRTYDDAPFRTSMQAFRDPRRQSSAAVVIR